MIETSDVVQWIYETLTNDATLQGLMAGIDERVYEDIAPAGTTEPYIIITVRSERDVRTIGARIFQDYVALVKVVKKTPKFSDIQTIADRLDTLLEDASGSAGSVTVMSSERQEPFRLVQAGERQYRQLGGIYRIQAQET